MSHEEYNNLIKTCDLRMVKKKTLQHKWTFTSRFRGQAFGWRGSAKAVQRVKKAVADLMIQLMKIPGLFQGYVSKPAKD